LSCYFLIKSIALLGHFATQIPHPKHLIELKIKFPSSNDLALKEHQFSQLPQFIHLTKSVFAMKSLLIICGTPFLRNLFKTTQQHAQQLQIR